MARYGQPRYGTETAGRRAGEAEEAVQGTSGSYEILPYAQVRPYQQWGPTARTYEGKSIMMSRSFIVYTRINSAGALLAFRLLFDVFPQFIRG